MGVQGVFPGDFLITQSQLWDIHWHLTDLAGDRIGNIGLDLKFGPTRITYHFDHERNPKCKVATK